MIFKSKNSSQDAKTLQSLHSLLGPIRRALPAATASLVPTSLGLGAAYWAGLSTVPLAFAGLGVVCYGLSYFLIKPSADSQSASRPQAPLSLKAPLSGKGPFSALKRTFKIRFNSPESFKTMDSDQEPLEAVNSAGLLVTDSDSNSVSGFGLDAQLLGLDAVELQEALQALRLKGPVNAYEDFSALLSLLYSATLQFHQLKATVEKAAQEGLGSGLGLLRPMACEPQRLAKYANQALLSYLQSLPIVQQRAYELFKSQLLTLTSQTNQFYSDLQRVSLRDLEVQKRWMDSKFSSKLSDGPGGDN